MCGESSSPTPSKLVVNSHTHVRIIHEALIDASGLLTLVHLIPLSPRGVARGYQ